MAYKTENVIFGAADIYLAPRVKPGAGGSYTAIKLPSFTAPTAGKTVTARDDFANAADWSSIGLTTDGVEVEYAPEFTDIAADQLLDAAVIFKTAQTVTINTTMLEATLKNLAYVWGLQEAALRTSASPEHPSNKAVGAGQEFPEVDTIKANGEYTFTTAGTVAADEAVMGIDSGSLGDFPEERQIAFVGSAPRGPMNIKNKERVYHVRRILQTESSTFGLKRDEGTSLPVSFRALPDPAITGAQYGTIRDRKITA